MNYSVIVFGVLPLLLFVIVDSLSGIKAALITAIVIAVAEACLSLYFFGSLDWLTLVSVILVIVLAIVAYLKKNALHFKMQPVVLSTIIGLVFLITFFVGRPLLYELAFKYREQFPPHFSMMLLHPLMQQFLRLSSHYLGYAMLLHAFVTAWCAFKLSNWWWIAMRGVGFYLFSFVAMLLAKWQVGL